jgi:hypothetical protein
MRGPMSSVGNGGQRYAIRKMVSAAMADGGGTFDAENGARVNATDGFMVGLGTGFPEYGPALELTPAEMYSEAGIDAIAALINVDGGMVEYEYVGAWRNGDVFAWEISRNFTRKDTALKMGRIRGEHSIWDNANGAEIPV